MNFFMKSAHVNFFKSNYTLQSEFVCVDEKKFFQKSRKIMDLFHQYQLYIYQFQMNPNLQQQHRPLTFEEWLCYNNINNDPKPRFLYFIAFCNRISTNEKA